MDKGKPVPVILKKKVNETGPIEVQVHDGKIERKVVREEQVSFDKIVDDSGSQFYITGKTTKIGLGNFLQLIEKHNIGEVDNLFDEEIIVSSELITNIATASVVDEDEDDLKYVESLAVGVLSGGFFLSLFALLVKTQQDLKTYAWILLLVSGGFLGYYLVKGMKSGELPRVARICIKSLSKK